MEEQIQTASTLDNVYENLGINPEVAAMKSQCFANSSPEKPLDVDEALAVVLETERQYPTGIKFVILTISLMLGIFMVALDTTIISTAIPNITTQFHSISDIGWYSSAYLLPMMSLQPTFGKIYSYFNIKYVMLLALLCFEAGSLICALAPSSPVFILGRVVAGVGGAAIFGGGMTIIQLSVPLHKVSVYLSILSTMYGVAGLTGPPLGGLFTSSEKLTWRFCFYINLPFGAMSILAMAFAFIEPKEELSTLTFKEKLSKMDFGGSILFISSIVSLFLALQWGGNDVAWSNSRAWGLLLGFGLLLIAFVALQIYLGENATIPPKIFLNRSVVLAQMIAILMMMGTNTHSFYLPFYFQSAKNLSPSESGVRLLPYTLSVTAAELAVGTGVSMLGVYLPFMVFGTAIYIVGAGLICTLEIDTPTANIIGFQILAGVGFGSSLQLCATVMRANVKDKDIPVAGALSTFAPFFGGALAAGIGQNIFRTALTKQLLQSISPEETAAILEAGAGGGVELVPENLRVVVLEAYNYAVKRTFVMSAVAAGAAFLCTLGLKWRNIKKPHKEVVASTEEVEDGKKNGKE